MSTILERLKKIIVEQMGVDDDVVLPLASFTEDLNADSSDLAELIAAVEIEFSTTKQKMVIPARDIGGLTTIQDLIDYIHDHVPDD